MANVQAQWGSRHVYTVTLNHGNHGDNPNQRTHVTITCKQMVGIAWLQTMVAVQLTKGHTTKLNRSVVEWQNTNAQKAPMYTKTIFDMVAVQHTNPSTGSS